MDLEKVIIFALVATIFSVLLKKEQHHIGILMSIIVGVLIFLQLLAPLGEILNILRETGEIAGISNEYFSIIWKIIGIAYMTQFAAQICDDAGEKAISAKVELAGKVCIMATSTPILTALLQNIMNLI